MKISKIKEVARVKLTGNYIKCASSSLLYFIMITLLTFFQTKVAVIENSVVSAIVQALFLILNWVLSYGIVANVLDLVDIKTNAITDFINSTLKNFIRYLELGLRALVRILIPLLIFLFVAFYWCATMIAKINKVDFLCFNQHLVPLATTALILSLILLIYFILKYALIAYIYHYNREMDLKEILDNSKNLMKKNMGHFILLLLSFLHWFLIGALILLILNIFIEGRFLTPFIVLFYSILRPYIIVSKSEFYKELADVKEEPIKKKSKKSKENKEDDKKSEDDK